MKNNTAEFREGDKLVTAEPVLLTWASVNAPDEQYCTYSVEMKWPKGVDWVENIIQTVLEFENEKREYYGLKTVDVPTFLLDKGGDVRVDDSGEFYLPRASGKSNTDEYVTDKGKTVPKHGKNKPRVYDAAANPNDDLVIWTGDKCKVAFAVGFYSSSGDYGTKLYLKDVQQIEAGPGPSNSNPFGDETDGSNDSEGGDGIPF